MIPQSKLTTYTAEEVRKVIKQAEYEMDERKILADSAIGYGICRFLPAFADPLEHDSRREIERLRSVMRRVACQTTDQWAHDRLRENIYPEKPNWFGAVPLTELVKVVNRWRQRAYDAIPDEYTSRGLAEKYLKQDNEAAGLATAADDLLALVNKHSSQAPNATKLTYRRSSEAAEGTLPAQPVKRSG